MLRFLLTKLFTKREKMKGDDVKPFLDHLEDLRGTIFKMALTLVVAVSICYIWHKDVIHILQEPIIKAGFEPKKVLQLGGFTDAFMITLSISFYAGMVVAFPILIYFLGQFVLPAMTDKEKRMALPALIVGFILFLCGVTFAFKFIMPAVTKFMIGTAVDLDFLQNMQANSYFKTVALLCVIFGLLCQVPVVMVSLHGLGIISYAWIKSTRAYGYTSILVLCGIVSPTPDIPSLVLISLPIIGLYEVCIWVIYFLEKRKKPEDTSVAISVAPAAAAVAYGDSHSSPSTDSHAHSDPYYDDPSHYTDGHYHDDHYHREHPEPEPEKLPEEPAKIEEPTKAEDKPSEGEKPN